MGVLPPTKTTQYLLACLSLWCTGALLAVCHDATYLAVDSGVIAKWGAAPHSGIRIKRAPSREPVRAACATRLVKAGGKGLAAWNYRIPTSLWS